jgi:CheY-like chemotaxis protein
MLEDYGYTVTAFPDAIQAFDAFKKNPYQFDLIITDMAMPGMTGDEFSVRILTLKNDVPIILCTGYSETISEVKALALGIKKYIQKPVDSQTLLLLIHELLEKNHDSIA